MDVRNRWVCGRRETLRAETWAAGLPLYTAFEKQAGSRLEQRKEPILLLAFDAAHPPAPN